jgi:hypothetical protein
MMAFYSPNRVHARAKLSGSYLFNWVISLTGALSRRLENCILNLRKAQPLRTDV